MLTPSINQWVRQHCRWACLAAIIIACLISTVTCIHFAVVVAMALLVSVARCCCQTT